MKNLKLTKVVAAFFLIFTSSIVLAESVSFQPLTQTDFGQMEMGASCHLEENGQVYAVTTGPKNLYIRLNQTLIKLVPTSDSNLFFNWDKESFYNIPDSEYEIMVTPQRDGRYTIQSQGILIRNLKFKCGC